MDVNVLHAKLDWLATQIIENVARRERCDTTNYTEADFAEMSTELAQGFLDLNEWIRNGGFLPTVWRPLE